ncbi:MAG: diaminopimelate decarboxylase [Bacteroidales bacterium]
MTIKDHISSLQTPFFFFDKSILKQEVKSLENVFSTYWPNYAIGYSVKTNSFPPLACYLKSLGIEAEVVSEDEYNLALTAGYDPKNIICNGPIKSQLWIDQILQTGSLLNIDSKREIDFVIDFSKKNPTKKISIGIRTNLDIESYFPGESNAGEKGSRFGFCYENGALENVINRINEYPNIDIVGLHVHVSTKTRRIEIYRWLVRQFTRIVKQYALKSINYLDIGGSFFGGIPNKPGWREYISGISEELRIYGYSSQNLKLIIEPGVSLLAGCFSYYTRVVDVKQTNRRNLVLLDGSRIHIDPLMHKTAYFYHIERCKKSFQPNLGNIENQDLVGFTCLENDMFFELKNTDPLQEGDIIRFDKVGAYTMTFTPLFISFFPAVYTLQETGEIDCLRPKWGVNEFIQLSKISL